MPPPRLLLALLLVAAAAALPAVAAETATAGTRSCAEAVLRDWHEGRIGEHYAPGCYQAALESLPEDMRVYSSAADDIETALHARLTALARRAHGAKRHLLSARESLGSSATEFPTPVLVAAAGAAVLVGLAGISTAARRRRRAK
jgi:hypothetical protein